MRSVLVSLGPWGWPAVFGIAAVLVIVVFLWRKLERLLDEEPAPIDGRWIVFTSGAVALASYLLLLAINRLAPVEIKSYGVMLLCGFVAGIIYAYKVGPQRGLTLPMIIDMTLLDLVLAIVGARVIFVLTMYQDYASAPSTVLDVWRGGLSFHGGLLGAVVATVIFCRWRKVRFAVLADICTPGVTLGYALTRIGCFLNGCCHGGPTDLPWGVVFPENAAHFPMPVQPTQIYSAIGSIVLFFILTRLWPRMHRPGQLFPAYLVLYSILRFFMEATRRGATAEPSSWLPVLTVGQVACVAIALAGLVWFVILQRMPYENPLTASALLSSRKPSEPSRTTSAESKSAARKHK